MDSVLITGIAFRLPGAQTYNELYAMLHSARVSIRNQLQDTWADDVTGLPWEDVPSAPAAAVLTDIDRFENELFDIDGHEAELLDPQQRVLMEVVWNALESSNTDPSRGVPGAGLFVGSTPSTYVFGLMSSHTVGSDRLAELLNIHSWAGFVARLSHALGIDGPGLALESFSSSGLVAFHLGVESLLNHECDRAIVCGASIKVPQFPLYKEASRSGRCLPFDRRADGSVVGNGAICFILERESDAKTRGAPHRARILGTATNMDGRSYPGIRSFECPAKERVMVEAMMAGGVDRDSIDYVEAHACGVELADRIELAAISRAYQSMERSNELRVGSLAGNIGHLDSIAGLAGLLKCVLMVEQRVCFPQVMGESPLTTGEGLPTGIVISPEPREQLGKNNLRVAVNSFGLGGVNANVILEHASNTYPAQKATFRSSPVELHLSQRSGAMLKVYERRLLDAVLSTPGLPIGYLRSVMADARPRWRVGADYLVSSSDELADQLRNSINDGTQEAHEREGCDVTVGLESSRCPEPVPPLGTGEIPGTVMSGKRWWHKSIDRSRSIFRE